MPSFWTNKPLSDSQIRKILLEIETRNLNCEERFKNIKTVQEDFKEINQRDLDTKAGMCRTNSNGPCRYD